MYSSFLDAVKATGLVLILALVFSPAARAQQFASPGTMDKGGTSMRQAGPDLSNVGIDQKLDAQVPLDLAFHDETGQTVTLQKYFKDRPVLLSLVYFKCPMMCPQLLSGMTSAMNKLTLDPGTDYQVVTVSFDPKDTPQDAAAEKAEWLKKLEKPGGEQSWHFLTGDPASIQKLTDAVGFRYHWDAGTQQFVHATAIMVVTPEGKLSKYFYGVVYSPTDLRFGLVQASNHQIGSPVDQILLFCCQYNPTTGKYDLLISRVLFLAGAATIVILGGFLWFMFHFGGKKKDRSKTAVPVG